MAAPGNRVLEAAPNGSEFDPGDDYVNVAQLYENGIVDPGQEYAGGVFLDPLNKGVGNAYYQSESTVLTLPAGSSTTLGELLQIRTEIGNEFGVGGTLTLDDSNTSFITITPLTPGFSFTTASGLSYVPEASGVLVAGLCSLGILFRRRT